jgi:hypothetical protein
VADEKQNADQDMEAASRQPKEGQSGDPSDTSDKTEKSEWLRDQVGEDHNLSGSSTYRTLPDQPEGDQPDLDPGDSDAKDRQSNR